MRCTLEIQSGKPLWVSKYISWVFLGSIVLVIHLSSGCIFRCRLLHIAGLFRSSSLLRTSIPWFLILEFFHIYSYILTLCSIVKLEFFSYNWIISFFYLRSIFLLFVLLSLVSRWSPKYSAVGDCAISMLFRYSGAANMIWLHLVSSKFLASFN